MKLWLKIVLIVAVLGSLFIAYAEKSEEGKTGSDKPLATATFAGGCFWCMEPPYDKLAGVISTTSGYTGGRRKNPTYEEVSGGTTGHAEAVQVAYDPTKVSYEKLLEVFWQNIDPFTPNAQFCDHGSQYRSAIFYHTPEQQAIAAQVIQEFTAAGLWKAPIVTEVVPFTAFYPAEDYHQEFFQRHPEQLYCQFVISPKIAKFRKAFLTKLRA